MNKKSTLAWILASMMLLTSCGNGGADESMMDETQIDIGGETTVDTSAAETEAIPAYDYEANDLTGFIKLGLYEGLNVIKASSELTDEEFEQIGSKTALRVLGKL